MKQRLRPVKGLDESKYQLVYQGDVMDPKRYFVLMDTDIAAVAGLSGYIEALNIVEEYAILTPEHREHIEQLRDDVAALRAIWEDRHRKVPD